MSDARNGVVARDGDRLLGFVFGNLVASPPGAVPVVGVCGHHDDEKLGALLASGLSRASEWLVAPVRDGRATP